MAATVIASDGGRFVLEEDVAAQCGMIGDFTSGTFGPSASLQTGD